MKEEEEEEDESSEEEEEELTPEEQGWTLVPWCKTLPECCCVSFSVFGINYPPLRASANIWKDFERVCVQV